MPQNIAILLFILFFYSGKKNIDNASCINFIFQFFSIYLNIYIILYNIYIYNAYYKSIYRWFYIK